MNPLNKMPVNSSNAGRSVPNYHAVPKIHRSILNESEKSTDYNQTASQRSVTHGPASKTIKHMDESEHSLYRKKLKKRRSSKSTASTESDSSVDDIKGHASFQTQTTYFTKLVSQATARTANFPDVDDVSESTNSNCERAGEHFDDVSAVKERVKAIGALPLRVEEEAIRAL